MTLTMPWSGRWRGSGRNAATHTYRSAPTSIQALQEEIARWRRQAFAAESRAAQAEASAAQLEERLYRDQLTGLRSRTWLMDHWPAWGDQIPAALALLDLDRFKAINDTYGHAAGDAVLVEVARRLITLAGMTPVRLHGDEIAVLVWRAWDASTVAAQIAQVLAAPIRLAGGQSVTASVGVVPVRAGAALGDVLRAADAAMYAEKERKRS